MDIKRANRTYHEAQSSMELLPNYYLWTYGKFSQFINGIVVELGCGAGIGIASYFRKAERVYAVDHDTRLLRRVAERFPSSTVTPIAADLIGEWSELVGIEADVVIIMDVLEHFEDDFAFMRKAAALLKPSGRLIVKVPAQRRLYSEIDRASGHYRRYDSADIRRLARDVGLSITFVRSMNPIGGLVYRLKNKARSNFSKTFSPLQLKVINAAIPLISMVDLIPALPGLSLIALMEKRKETQ